LKKIKPRF